MAQHHSGSRRQQSKCQHWTQSSLKTHSSCKREGRSLQQGIGRKAICAFPLITARLDQLCRLRWFHSFCSAAGRSGAGRDAETLERLHAESWRDQSYIQVFKCILPSRQTSKSAFLQLLLKTDLVLQKCWQQYKILPCELLPIKGPDPTMFCVWSTRKYFKARSESLGLLLTGSVKIPGPITLILGTADHPVMQLTHPQCPTNTDMFILDVQRGQKEIGLLSWSLSLRHKSQLSAVCATLCKIVHFAERYSSLLSLRSLFNSKNTQMLMTVVYGVL